MFLVQNGAVMPLEAAELPPATVVPCSTVALTHAVTLFRHCVPINVVVPWRRPLAETKPVADPR